MTTNELHVSRSSFMDLISTLNNQQGTTKPEEFVAAIFTLFDTHPDYLGTTKVTAGRLRAQWKRMQDSAVLAVAEAVRIESEALNAGRIHENGVMADVPDAPAEIVAELVAHGVSENVVRTLWVKRPYWVKVQCKVFCELVRKGMIDTPDAFFVSAVTKGWLLCSNYDKHHKSREQERVRERLEVEIEEVREQLVTSHTESTRSKADAFLNMGLKALASRA